MKRFSLRAAVWLQCFLSLVGGPGVFCHWANSPEYGCAAGGRKTCGCPAGAWSQADVTQPRTGSRELSSARCCALASEPCRETRSVSSGSAPYRHGCVRFGRVLAVIPPVQNGDRACLPLPARDNVDLLRVHIFSLIITP